MPQDCGRRRSSSTSNGPEPSTELSTLRTTASLASAAGGGVFSEVHVRRAGNCHEVAVSG